MAGTDTPGRAIPKPALILGLAGLIPFFAPALGLWSRDPSLMHNALIMQFGYAAVILSFLGGVHWGRALAGDACRPNWARLLWSVTPATLGWALLLLPDPHVILGGFAVAFALAYLVDRKAVAVGMFPAWYGRLRKILTIGVLTALILTLVAGYGTIAV
ncbi:MAG: DUF3429 domain-containing protein [Alphaproteobacteria bacterium]|nr:DUF3429 domain-containing protein [Alphaproteobacteria bacterium]